MDLIKLFVDNEENIEINIIGTKENPLFQANQIGKLLGLKNINKNIKDFDDDEKVITLSYTHGGNQNISFLTEIGLYRLLGMSKKEKARKFQKWVAIVIKEIRLKGNYELEKSLKETIENTEYEKELTRHKTLLETLKETQGVYIGKIRNMENNKIFIKIGNTKDIKERTRSLKKSFGTFILLDFFESLRHQDFEKSILKDSTLIEYKYSEKINGDTSTETFLIPKDFYEDLITIIKRKQKDYISIFNTEQLFELEKDKKEIKKIKEETEKLKIKENIEILELRKLELKNNLELTEIKRKEIIPSELPINFNYKLYKGPKVQKYSLDSKLIKTYLGIRDVARTEYRIDESALRLAIKNNYIYKDFRWLFLDKDLPDDTIQELPEIKLHKNIPVEFIVMLDNTKTKIIEIFSGQKEASENRKLASTLCIYKSIKYNIECKGHYFILYSNCPNDLLDKYLETNKLPEIKRHFNAVKVKQINPINNELIEEFSSYNEVCLKYQISLKKIKEAIKTNEIYKGFKWSY